MTFYDPTRNCYIQFKSIAKRDKFLAKLKEAEQAKMKELIHGNFKYRFK